MTTNKPISNMQAVMKFCHQNKISYRQFQQLEALGIVVVLHDPKENHFVIVKKQKEMDYYLERNILE